MSDSDRKPGLEPLDIRVIAGQLSRAPRDVVSVAVRCSHGFPVVIESLPTLSDGTPNPTLLYVTCPALTTAISTLEAGGGVKELRTTVAKDIGLKATLEELTAAYQARRGCLAEPAGEVRPEAGIGGPTGPDAASCLHAYGAALLAAAVGNLPVSEALRKSALAAFARLYWDPSPTWCAHGRCRRWAKAETKTEMRTGVEAELVPESAAQSAVELLDDGGAEVERRAVIDVGTVSVRLLVADVQGGSLEEVVRNAQVTRLGEGLVAGSPLQPAARTRTGMVIRRFAKQAVQLEAKRIRLVGTSAARDAPDGETFIHALGDELDLDAAVLTGEDEARAAYAGATLDVSDGPLVLDVGGGSTELIRRAADSRLDSVSLDLGASRATTKWIHSDPPTKTEVDSIFDESLRAFAGVAPRFGATCSTRPSAADIGADTATTGARLGGGDRPQTLVGVAGTVVTLACLDAGLGAYDRVAVHLRVLTRQRVSELLADLSGMTLQERAQLPCMQTGRAEVIVAGTAIVLAAMEALGYDRMTVSECDLLDGLVLDEKW